MEDFRRQKNIFVRTIILVGVTLLLSTGSIDAAAKAIGIETRAEEIDEEEKTESEGFKPFWQILLREEPGYLLDRQNSLLNPNDILGMPRLQNRFLVNFDTTVPIVDGKGINPLAEFVIGDTFLYLQYEGSEPTPAKPQISDARNFLKEAYLNIRPTSFWSLSAGRRNITDGVAYSHNVVDFLANPTTLPGVNFDNRFRIKNREGSILLRNEFLWKGGALSYTYVPSLTTSDASDPKIRTEVDRLTQFNRQDAHWLKLYQYVGGFDVSLHYFYKGRHNAGLALAKVFGDALELHGELRAQNGSTVMTPYEQSADVYFGPSLVQPAIYNYQGRSDATIYTRGIFGGQYTFENKLNLSVEYYYNGEGYSQAQMDALYSGLALAGSRYTNPAFNFPQGNPYQMFLYAANMNFSYMAMGEHYLFLRLADPEFFGSSKWEAAVYSSVLLSDGSGMAAADISYKIDKHLDVQLLVNVFFGNSHSEAGLFYQGLSSLVALQAQF